MPSIEQLLFWFAVVLFIYVFWYIRHERIKLSCGCRIYPPRDVSNITRWALENNKIKSYRGTMTCNSCGHNA